MSATLRTVCISAVFIALLLSLAPEGGAKKIARLCAACVLCLIIAGGIGRMDFEAYALSIAEYDAQAEKMKKDALEASAQMNRLVIESRCETYIMDKAAELGLEPGEVKVLAAWNREGVWVPKSVRVKGERSEALSEIISAQLGIAPEDQEWINGEAAANSE